MVEGCTREMVDRRANQQVVVVVEGIVVVVDNLVVATTSWGGVWWNGGEVVVLWLLLVVVERGLWLIMVEGRVVVGGEAQVLWLRGKVNRYYVGDGWGILVVVDMRIILVEGIVMIDRVVIPLID